jgi:flagellar basal-body rod protein FlgF
LIRGLYASASGMLAEQARMDVIANNVANANTTGFRKETAVTQSFGEMLIRRINDYGGPPGRPPLLGSLGTGAGPAAVYTSTLAGSLKQSASPLDIAIEGDAYLLVRTPQGDRLTRNGVLQLEADGLLVTGERYPVLGEAGEIRLPPGEVIIDSAGRISVAGETVATLQLVVPTPDGILEKEGNSLYRATGGYQAATDSRVRQGFVEAANVNAIQEMVSLIEVMRVYEANQKVIQTQDATLDKAVNEVGRV